MVDERVREIEPHRGIEDVPAGEIAVRDSVACVGHLYTDLEVIASVCVDCRRVSAGVPRERYKGKRRPYYRWLDDRVQ